MPCGRPLRFQLPVRTCHPKGSVIEFDVVDCRLQDVGRNPLTLFDDDVCRLFQRRTTHTGRARAEGTPGSRDDIGVRSDDADILQRQPQELIDVLGIHRFVSLALRISAHEDRGRPIGVQSDLHGFVNAPGTGHFDAVGEPETTQTTMAAGRRPTRRKPRVVGDLKDSDHIFLELAAVVVERERRLIGGKTSGAIMFRRRSSTRFNPSS